jgi:hypothetical protein
MKSDECTEYFITTTQDIVNGSRSQGEFVIIKRIVEKILIYLVPKYNLVAKTIDEIKYLTTLEEI